MTARTAFAHPWTWDRGRPDAIEGAMIRTGTRHIFVTGRDLRKIADRLHDIADQLDEEVA